LRQRILSANTAAEAFEHALREDVPLADLVAQAAWHTAARVLEGADIGLDVALFDRDGQLLARTPPALAHGASSPRNR
jgi:cobalt-precorrin-5B (C1)-methyltransferase